MCGTWYKCAAAAAVVVAPFFLGIEASAEVLSPLYPPTKKNRAASTVLSKNNLTTYLAYPASARVLKFSPLYPPTGGKHQR